MAAKLREEGHCSNKKKGRKKDMPRNLLYSPITGITCSDVFGYGCRNVLHALTGLRTRSLQTAPEIRRHYAND